MKIFLACSENLSRLLRSGTRRATSAANYLIKFSSLKRITGVSQRLSFTQQLLLVLAVQQQLVLFDSEHLLPYQYSYIHLAEIKIQLILLKFILQKQSYGRCGGGWSVYINNTILIPFALDVIGLFELIMFISKFVNSVRCVSNVTFSRNGKKHYHVRTSYFTISMIT